MIERKTKTGTVFVVKFDEDESPFDYDTEGACIYCGAEASGVEPDARKYECESCGRNGVYGFEEMILMGYCA
jgi:hypothetical protein